MSAEKVIAMARSQVGYLEKASNANLDSTTGNAGYNNYTKYARDLAAAGYYNGNKNGYAWCDVFVDWCFFKVYGSKAKAEEIECQTGNLGAGCYYSAQYYKNQGRYDKTPKAGDQIFFTDSAGDICHTGIVSAVTASTVYTIEGNTSSASGVVDNGGAVAEKSYSRGYSRIAGYGHPKYEAVKKTYPEGWQHDNKGWWWQNADGSYVKKAWKQVKGKWYYMEGDGYMAENKWIYGETSPYYVGEDGAMVTNRTIMIDGEGKVVPAGNYYTTLGQLPKGSDYRTALGKAIAKGILKGYGGQGDSLILNMAENDVRMMVFLDRAGVLG